MNYNVEDIGATKKQITVEVPVESVKKEFNRAVKAAGKQARLKGFRPGKAPAAIVKKMFLPQIEQDVSQTLINDTLPDILKEFSETMASQPVLEDQTLLEDQPFKYIVSFDVYPVFEVSGYEGLELSREKINISDEVVDKKIDDLRTAYATTKSVEEDRDVRDGDLAVVDYKGFSEEGELDGAANSNYQLEVGAGFFNADFEKELVGMKKGDEKEISVDFPEQHYNPKLKGKSVRFEVKLVDIKEKIVPELTDEFVKDLGQELETVDQLKEKIKEDMTAVEERRVDNLVRQELRDKLIDLVEFEVPEGLVHQEVESMLASTSMNLRRSGISIEAMGLSEDKLREDYKPEAEKRVKTGLILSKIAKDKGIEATDEDLDEAINKTAADVGQSPDVVREIYNKNNMMSSLTESVLSEKTLKFILDDAKITDVEPSVEEGVEKDD